MSATRPNPNTDTGGELSRTRGKIFGRQSLADDDKILFPDFYVSLGVPVVSVQETTIRGSTVNTVEAHEGLLLCIPQTKTPDYSNAWQ
jgi:hypothetical protein